VAGAIGGAHQQTRKKRVAFGGSRQSHPVLSQGSPPAPQKAITTSAKRRCVRKRFRRDSRVVQHSGIRARRADENFFADRLADRCFGAGDRDIREPGHGAVDRIDGELHQHAKADPRVKVLRTLPGVGEFTALVMLAEIGDITRFGSARKLASWAGLTPTVRGSDLKVRHGNIPGRARRGCGGS